MVNIYYGNWDTCNKAETNGAAGSAPVEPLLDATARFSWRQEGGAAEDRQSTEASADDKPPELRPGYVSNNASSPGSGPAASGVACSNSATPVIFDDFVKSLDQTCWMNIVKSYYDKDGNFLSNRVQFTTSLKVPASDSCYQVLPPSCKSSSVVWERPPPPKKLTQKKKGGGDESSVS